MNTRNVLSFSEKKVSRNAVFTLALGIAEIIGFLILILISVLSNGALNVIGGLAGCLLVLLAFFGVFWGILSYDDVRTNQRFKISGICVNIIVIFIGITFVML